MKYCSGCGAQNEDATLFCENCGKSFEAAPQQAQPAQANPYYNYNAQPPMQQPAPQIQNPYGGQPIMQPQNAAFYNPLQNPGQVGPGVGIMKTILRSPLFLTAAIAFTAYLFFTFIAAFMPMNVSAVLLEMFEDILPYELWDALDAMADAGSAGYAGFMTIMGMIPMILISIGLWQMFSLGKSQNNYTGGGFSLAKIGVTINFVVQIIAYSVIFIALIIIMFAAMAMSYSGESGAILIVFVFIILLVAAAFAFTIIYYSKLLKSLGALSSAGIMQVPQRLSSFVAVVFCLRAFSGVMGALFSLVYSPVSAIAELAMATFYVLIAVCMFNYNNKLGSQALQNPQQY